MMLEAATLEWTRDHVHAMTAGCGPCAGLGVDAVSIAVWERHLEAGGDRLLRRIYTSAELDFCAGRVDRLAVRMAAKEAALKALGTGMRGVRLYEVEIASRSEGLPELFLHGAAAERAERLGWRGWRVSLCHEEDLALAVVVAWAEGRRA
jgi:holo-[acyl-carrier protein] synthase